MRLADANADGRIILTEDHDFTDVVMAQGLPTHVLILVALHGFGRQARINRIVQAVVELEQDFGGVIAMIEPARIVRRMRSLTNC